MYTNVNANSVFAIPDLDPQDRDSLTKELREFFKDKGYEYLWMDDPYTERSFGAESIASIEESKMFKVKTSSHWTEVEVKVYIEVYLRFGDFKGANMDWVLYYVTIPDIDLPDPDQIPTLGQIAEDVTAQVWDENFQYSHAEYLAKRIRKWFMVRGNVLINKTEKIMAQVSTPLREVGTLGSGKTFYQQIN